MRNLGYSTNRIPYGVSDRGGRYRDKSVPTPLVMEVSTPDQPPAVSQHEAGQYPTALLSEVSFGGFRQRWREYGQNSSIKLAMR